jgi:hypothetical protein
VASVARSIQTLSAIQSVSLSLSGRAGTERYRGIYTPPTHTTPNLREKEKKRRIFIFSDQDISFVKIQLCSRDSHTQWAVVKDNDLNKKNNEIRIEEQTPEVR